jgi:tetratricopeptide (TPR) repeat protein
MAGNQDFFQKAMNAGHSAAWDQTWAKAVDSYRKALNEFPDNPTALTSMGMAQYELGDFSAALKAYQRVNDLIPDDPQPLEKIAQCCERLGKLNECIQSSMKAAELFLKKREVDKAINDWLRVLRFNPNHLQARSRLAVVYEKTNRKMDAANEFLSISSIFQQNTDYPRAKQAALYAKKLAPDLPQADKALSLLEEGKSLPLPPRPKGGTGPILMAQVRKMDEPKPGTSSLEGKDPISEARQKAMVRLAGILFEQAEENQTGQIARRGLQAIMRGTGTLSLEQSERNQVMLHLGQAIDAQTQGNDVVAQEELEKAIEAGLTHTAAYFDLGLLRFKSDRLESAIRYLSHAVKHPDFAMGAHLLLGQAYQKLNRIQEASLEFLEALKIADGQVVPPEQADELLQLYDPIIEAERDQKDPAVLSTLCDNISEQLLSPTWRLNLDKARNQLPQQAEGSPALPLAEMMLVSHSHEIIENMMQVRDLAKKGFSRSAMEEAYFAIGIAPTYLPLHIQMGELLMKENMTQEAIEKFTVVAQTFSARGEFTQSANLLRRVIQLAPMDLAARGRLIDQLVSQGQIPEAIREYIDLSEIYTHLAELDMARKTLMIALRLTQQAPAYQTSSIEILNRIADIDMQRLDWRQAVRVYEQIRTVQPGDTKSRNNLIDLNFRLGQETAALTEVDSYLSYLETRKQQDLGIEFLVNLVTDRPSVIELRQRLAELYRQVGRIDDAVAQLDRVGDMFMDSGNQTATIAVIQTILSLNPKNGDDYRKLLQQLQNGEIK